jgi:RNA polymerase sigma-70 factor (ECF subfamily)
VATNFFQSIAVAIMGCDVDNLRSAGAGGYGFQTTHWSVVLRAGELDSPEALTALESLCRTYWYPLYAFLRRRGHNHEQAQDLTQAFLARLVHKHQIPKADPVRGRFRTFLLSSLENFARSHHRDAHAEKRGGLVEMVSLELKTADERYSTEPVDDLSPDRFYEKQWAGALLQSVLVNLRQEFTTGGRQELFDALEPHLWGDDDSTPYAGIGKTLNMTVVAIRVTLHRLRQRFQDLLRLEVAHTIDDPAAVDDELRQLRRALTV